MQLTSYTGRLPLARVLAFVALLCAGGLQVQEAGHGHWFELDDSYAQCLLCKSSGSATLPAYAPPVAVNGTGPSITAYRVPLMTGGITQSFDARGPPHYS